MYTAHRWPMDSRRQLPDCFQHRVAEVAQRLPLQSPVQGGTDVGAGQPEFDVISLVDNRILHTNFNLQRSM